jgi:uncharacterized protein (TIGR02217 family)
MAFDEVRFPTDISQQSAGGPSFMTIIVALWSKAERRIVTRAQSRLSWNVSHGVKSQATIEPLIAFFYAREGRARGFRYQDPTDFEVEDSPLTVDGSPTVQLTKRYTSGVVTHDRKIVKPTTSTVPEAGGVDPTFELNGSPYTPADVDETTGIITLGVAITKNITAITKAASAVVTVGAAHGFVTGDFVYISGVLGMTQINGRALEVTATGATTITVDVDSTDFSTYTSGGTAVKYDVQPSDDLTWSGEFDVPARFDTDAMSVSGEDNLREWNSIPIVEINPQT